MKTSGKIILASLLVVGLLVVTFGSVFAAFVPTPSSFNDPVAMETFTGEKYTAKVVTPPNMPGTMDDAGLILPAGLGTNEGQFSGSGLTISGLKAGEYVDIKFDFKLYNYMWKGSIYKWSGTKWVKLATKVVEPGPDESITWATTTAVGNGTYALIVGNYGVPTVKPLD